MYFLYNLYQNFWIFINKLLFVYRLGLPTDTRILFGGFIVGSKESIKIGNHVDISGKLICDGKGKIAIGNNCTINERTVLRSSISITVGNYVMISSDCYIIDNNSHSLDFMKRREDLLIGQNRSLEERDVKFGAIIIEDDTWIGRGVYILKGVTIGKGSIIGAGSIVTKDVDPYSIVAGNPAKEIKKLYL